MLKANFEAVLEDAANASAKASLAQITSYAYPQDVLGDLNAAGKHQNHEKDAAQHNLMNVSVRFLITAHSEGASGLKAKCIEYLKHSRLGFDRQSLTQALISFSTKKDTYACKAGRNNYAIESDHRCFIITKNSIAS